MGNERPLHLDVEIMGAPANHLGVFTGGKIRVARSADRGTLAHEIAHAHAYALSGPSAWKQHNHTRFFDEGLASWAEGRISGKSEIPLVVGAIYRTDQAHFELLVENELLSARQDMAQAYPLGHAFVAVLAREEGPDAVPCVLKALADVGGETVAGLALWYDLADTCQIDLDGVVRAWDQALADAGDALPATLPRLHARIVDENAVAKVLWVDDDNHVGWPLLCRFRDNEEASVAHYYHRRVRDGKCRVPRSQLSGQTFDYQLGFELPGGEWTVFSPWAEAPL